MKFKDIPTIQRQHATVDQRLAWCGALSAPGKTLRRRHNWRSRLIGLLVMLLVLLLCSWEGVLPWLTR